MVAIEKPGEIARASTAPGWLKNFFPGYFALVMATGIVSLACHLQGLRTVAKALFWINIPAYAALWGITIWRLARFPREVIKDLTSHARGATFLTMVAATGVLGKQFVMLSSNMAVGKCLWVVALLLWAILIYVFFTAITLTEPKPKLEAGINGGWLLAVVATESLCTLGTVAAPSFGRPDLVLFVSLAAYLLGAMLYIVLITLILYRWFFRSMEANMLTPPYWINMGALAITTLGGARLLTAAQTNPILQPYQPFIAGFTMFFWSTATWWIPLLIIVGVWRHVSRRLPLQYDPQYWSLVFPLGMYSVATFIFADAASLPFLKPIPMAFAVAGVGAWIVTFFGLVAHVIRGVKGTKAV